MTQTNSSSPLIEQTTLPLRSAGHGHYTVEDPYTGRTNRQTYVGYELFYATRRLRQVQILQLQLQQAEWM